MSENLLLYDESPELISGIKERLAAKDKNRISKFAFALTTNFQELDEQQKELVEKIIKSVNQQLDETLIFNINDDSFSLQSFHRKGLDSLIIFADSKPQILGSINYQQNIPFSISGVACFSTVSLSKIVSDNKSKNLLWAFMKSRL